MRLGGFIDLIEEKVGLVRVTRAVDPVFETAAVI